LITIDRDGPPRPCGDLPDSGTGALRISRADIGEPSTAPATPTAAPTSAGTATYPVTRSLTARVAYLGDFSTPFAGALGFGSPLSLPYALDLAVPALRSAVGGTPASI
jgi:hypothetical protein